MQAIMFDSIDSLLRRSLRRHHLTESVGARQTLDGINHILAELFGQGIDRKARAIMVQENRITIACTSSVLASEIRLQEQKILRTLARGKFRFHYRLR